MIVRVLLVLLALVAAHLAAPQVEAREGYRTAGQCDGFPRVALTTSPRLCVGLVVQHLGFLRGLALVGSDVYVTDLASRTAGRGRVLRLGNFGRDAAQVVLTGLNQPNTILQGRDGWLYVGEVGRITRFDPRAPSPQATIEAVVTGIPTDGRHNLVAFTFAPDGAILLNVPTASDNCEQANGRPPDPNARCREFLLQPPRGTVIRVAPGRPRPFPLRLGEVFASGIRNAMAFVWPPGGDLLAVSNSRDNINSADPRLSDEKLPHDVLLRIAKGDNLGWPYCFDNRRPSPEYPRYDCRRMRAPAALLPPHAAPLSMIRYTGERLPGLNGKLVIGYHGYRALGHRIVTVALDAAGNPAGAPVDLVSGWTAVPGLRPQGAPTAMLQLPDGSILVAEDLNRSILRISTRQLP